MARPARLITPDEACEIIGIPLLPGKWSKYNRRRHLHDPVYNLTPYPAGRGLLWYENECLKAREERDRRALGRAA